MADAVAVVAERRDYDMLDAEGQERVTLMLKRYSCLLPLERNAFLQALGLVPAQSAAAAADKDNGVAPGAVVHYHSSRLDDVCARDARYVALQSAADTHATMLRRLMTPAVFGEAPVQLNGPRTCDTAVTGDDDAAHVAAAAGDTAAADAMQGMSRSHAYQALRLAHSFPGRINVRARGDAAGVDASSGVGDGDALSTLNMTGVPLYEKELRSWFDQLDREHTGMLSTAQFQACMQALERDFGVSDEYARLAAEGQRLAKDDCLTFEAFAYLIMRFARA